MKAFPNHIRILGNQYQIKLVPALKDGDESLWGRADTDKRVIQLNADMDTRRRWETLIHEALHAIWGSAGVGGLLGNGDSDIEEMIVRVTELGLIQIIEQYGQDIVKYIKDEHREG